MNDRFKFRAWNKIKKEYSENIQECSSSHFNGMCIECFEDYLNDDDYIIEQCTGMKDKNDKLIYEGDIINVTQFYNGIPINKKRSIKVIYKFGRFNIHDLSSYYLEIIGNIHQNKDLLGE